MEEEQVDGLDSEAPATDRIPLGVRLFLIPFVIVLVCGAVLLIGRLLAGGPTTASEYLDDIPNDPFSGRPLLFNLEGNGIAIYSVGDDREDDGGVGMDNLRLRDDGDMVFHVIRSEPNKRGSN